MLHVCVPPVDKDDSRASLALLNYGQFIVYDFQKRKLYGVRFQVSISPL